MTTQPLPRRPDRRAVDAATVGRGRDVIHPTARGVPLDMDTATPRRCGRSDAIGYPWTYDVNPGTADAESAAEAWATSFGLLDDAAIAVRFHGVSVGRLAGLTHPRTSPTRLELIAQVMAWIFLEDDDFDEGGEERRADDLLARFHGWLEILHHRAAPVGSPAVDRALADLARRLAAQGSARWYARFVSTMRRFWLEGVAIESWYRERGLTPDPASYMATRVQTVGVYICLALVELDDELDDAHHDDALLRRATWLTSRIIAYVNDIYSYEKERRADDPNNFVHVVRHHDGLDLDQAVARAARCHDLELAQFLDLARAIEHDRRGRGHAVGHYLEGCRAWMVGALHWQRTARRYAGGRALLEHAPLAPRPSPT